MSRAAARSAGRRSPSSCRARSTRSTRSSAIGAQIEDVLRAHRPEMGRGGREQRAIELLEMVGITARPAAQLPARAVRRHAPARHDRDGAGAGAAGRDHGRADHRAGRGHPAGDPRGDHGAPRRPRLRRPVHHARPVAARSSSPTRSRSCTPGASSSGRRPRRCSGRPATPIPTGLLNSFPPMHGARMAMAGIPGSPPDLRAVPSGCAFHPRCPYALERCPVDMPQLVPLSPGRYRTSGARAAGARARNR